MYRLVVCVLVLGLSLGESHASWGQYPIKTKSMFSSCKHDICNYLRNYPEDDVNKAMADQATLKYLLGGAVFNSSAGVVMETRTNFDETVSSQLCDTEGPVTHKPLVLRNMNLEYKLIVNTKRYHQLITVEACRRLAGARFLGIRNYCTDFGFKCKQNYQPLSLVVYENGMVQFDQFLLPTTCKCVCD